MIRELKGNNPYEKVSNATGDLAAKLQALIAKYAEDVHVFDLADEFINWWDMPFDAPGKDETGQSIWFKADLLIEMLDKEYSKATRAAAATSTTPSTSTLSTPTQTTSTPSRLEKAGDLVGRAIGKASAVTVNATIAGATVTGRWMKDSAAPAARTGGREFWKGMKATARATRDAYRESRVKHHAESEHYDESEHHDESHDESGHHAESSGDVPY